jgi:hypothetical protein
LPLQCTALPFELTLVFAQLLLTPMARELLLEESPMLLEPASPPLALLLPLLLFKELG